ncbi:MAG: hypothetical protein AMXMBFR84_37250 [Candidatus Hydrogenedentota bacterium]
MSDIVEYGRASLLRELENWVVGKTTWQAMIAHGTRPIINFGKPMPPIRPGRALRAEFQFFISSAPWRLMRDNVILTGKSDPLEIMEPEMRTLSGNRLLKIHIPRDTLDLELEFDNGYRFMTFRSSRIYTPWMFYTLENVIYLDIDGKFKSEPCEMEFLA